MRNILKRLGVGSFAVSIVLGMGMTSVQAAEKLPVPGDVANGRHIYFNGKGDAVPACASCHGEDGLGSDDMGTPRLAHQVYTYILKQLNDFAKGAREDTTLGAMNDIAKNLTDKEKRDVAAFVHTLKTPFMGSDLKALREAGETVGEPYKGRVIVEYGLPDHNVPACQSCHSYHGRSAGRLFPAIGGQRYKYIVNQLKKFRDGTRSNDPQAMMRKVAQNMTDEDIANAAAFLTEARPASRGNPRAPSREQY